MSTSGGSPLKCPVFGGVGGLVTDYITGRASDDDVAAFETHYFECEACWEEMQRALEIRAALAGTAGRAIPGTQTSVTSRRLRHGLAAWAVAAAALLLTALALWLPQAPWSGSRTPAVRGDREVLPLEVEAAAEGLILRWTPRDGAEVYRVRLFRPDGSLALEMETRESRVVLAPPSPPPPDPGAPARVRVQALDSLRQVVASSSLQALPASAGAPGP